MATAKQSRAEPDKHIVQHRLPPSRATAEPAAGQHTALAAQALRRAQHDPGALSSATLLALQRTAGNAAVNRLLRQSRRWQEDVVAADRSAAGHLEATAQAGRDSDSPVTQADGSPQIQRAGAMPADQTEQRLATDIRAAHGHGSPMPGPIRTNLESALGADLSGVRVHTDGEADRLSRSVQAVAFTTGTDIFFRGGAYSPATPQGLQLLAHEATHVAQQAAGPVSGTPHLEGVNISDPGDRFEQAAEITGAYIVGNRATLGTAGTAEQRRLQATSQAESPHEGITVQRKFGFELQSSGNKFVAHNGIPKLEEREIAYRDDAHHLTLEADEDPDPSVTQLEFVVQPCNTREEGEQAVKAAEVLANGLVEAAKGEKILVRGPAQNAAAAPAVPVTATASQQAAASSAPSQPAATHSAAAQPVNGWIRPVAIHLGDPAFKAAVQLTVGMELANLDAHLQKYYQAISGGQDDLARIAVMRGSAPSASSGSPALRGLVTAVTMFAYHAIVEQPYWIRNNDNAPPDKWFQLNDREDAGTDNWFIVEADGPKSLFALLPRTNFHAMFLSLPPNDRTAFQQWVSSRALATACGGADKPIPSYPYRADTNERVAETGADLRTNVSSAPYEGKSYSWNIIARGPRVQDWLLSILDGFDYLNGARQGVARGRDMMSPPPGWRSRAPDTATAFPQANERKSSFYGMGAFPMDNNLAIFEHRMLSHDRAQEFGALPLQDWLIGAQYLIDRYVVQHLPNAQPPTPAVTKQ